MRKSVIIVLVILVVAGAIGGGVYLRVTRSSAPSITVEALQKRNLEAIVSASGKIQPKRQVNISANQMGKVTRLSVNEGDRVKAGQFLLEIDPRQLEGQLQRGEAGVAAARNALTQARTTIEQARTTIEQARANLDLARQQLKRQEELWKDGLTTRETLEKQQNDVKVREVELRVREVELKSREQDIETRQQQIKQEEASVSTTRYNMSQIVINAPMDGIVTRRNIEEGETAVVGTMNNAGTVLLTIADMSVIEAEVEVDETDIPTVMLGQEAKVAIDAVPDRTFRGRVTEIGNSPIQAASGQGQQGATNFKVVITLEEAVPDVRPGFTCTAEIVTARRKDSLAVPIQALTVREMLFDRSGQIIHETPADRPRSGSEVEPTVSAAEPPPGATRKETEGVFVMREGQAVFVPVKLGIAGERYFEVLSGPRERDQVITGPFSSVRALADGEVVTVSSVDGR